MKGLLLKDMYELIKQCKFILLFCVVYVFLSYTESGYFFLAFSIIFFSLLPTTIMALDERSKWESYAITMPYTRKEMVLSKYILSLGGVIFMSVLYELVNIIIYFINSSYAMSIVDSFNIILPFCLMAIIISSINLPINFKFGAIKSNFPVKGICSISPFSPCETGNWHLSIVFRHICSTKSFTQNCWSSQSRLIFSDKSPVPHPISKVREE